MNRSKHTFIRLFVVRIFALHAYDGISLPRLIVSLKRILTLLVFMFASGNAIAGDIEMRQDLMTEVKFYLSRDSFSDLERLHTAFMKPDARFPSGVWKLFFFYAGMTQYFSVNADPLYWRSLEEKAASWRTSFPDSLVVPIFLAEIHLRRAWTYRGEALANEVRDWPKVSEYAGKAHSALLEQGPRIRANPAWYPTMFRVLDLYRGDAQEFAILLNEGMARHPDYHELYFRAAWSLQPKWGGSAEAIEAVASEAASRSSEGKSMYTRVYWYMDQAEYQGEIFKKSRADWTKMRSGFDDLVSKHPEAWTINSYAYFACLAGDTATLNELLRRIGSQANFDAWGPTQKRFYDQCVASLRPSAPLPKQSLPVG